MLSFIQDVKYSLRTLARERLFTLVVLVTLGLGIGANVAIFTLVNAVLLRSLSFHDPGRLAMVWEKNMKKASMDRMNTSGPTFNDWKAQSKVFEDMSEFTIPLAFRLTGISEAERLRGVKVGANFFSLLGVAPATGRAFLPEEGKGGSGHVVIVSSALWQQEFGGQANFVGSSITLNGEPYTVVGIMGPHFQMPLFDHIDVLLPIATDSPEMNRRDARMLLTVGRLKPQVTVPQAQVAMDTIASRLEQQYPQNQKNWGANVISLLDNTVGPVRPTLLILSGAVVFVLLIACGNVANLLLAKATTRQKEFAVRIALGAKKSHLVRQLLTESLLLSLLGGALGLGLAKLGVQSFVALNPNYFPRLREATLDASVLGFTLGLCLVTTLIFGLGPAMRTTSLNVNETLKEQSAGASTGKQRRKMGGILVVAEVTMALMLLTASGLLIKSFLQILHIDPGFNPKDVATMRISVTGPKYSDKATLPVFYDQLIQRTQSLPGVEAAAATSNLPMGGIWTNSYFSIPGQAPLGPGQEPLARTAAVTTSYFPAMEISLLKGRYFTEQDTETTSPVVIINQTLAQQFFHDEEPVGKQLTISSGTLMQTNNLQPSLVQIVGVVRDVKAFLYQPLLSEIYVPYRQNPLPVVFLTIKTHPGIDTSNLVASVRREVAALDKEQPVYDVKTMNERFADSLGQQRVSVFPFVVFGMVALILTSVGIYGVIAYSVAQRKHEIGIRMALGAKTRNVLLLVLGQGMLLVLIGIGLGLIGAFISTRLLSNMLVNVSSTDARTFVGGVLLLAAIGVLAIFIPARQATQVDPIVVLREQ